MWRRVSVLFSLMSVCWLLLGLTPVRGQEAAPQPFPGLAVVPAVGNGIRVAGEVTRPGVYETATATPQLVDVIRQAGGLSSNASGNIRIAGTAGDDRQTFYSPLLRFRLQPGDLVTADARPGRESGVQTISYWGQPGRPQPVDDEPAKTESAGDTAAAQAERSKTAGTPSESATEKEAGPAVMNQNTLIGTLLVLVACGLLWSIRGADASPHTKQPARLPKKPGGDGPAAAKDRQKPEFDRHRQVSHTVRGDERNGLLDRTLARLHGVDRA